MQPENQGTPDQCITASQLAEMGYCERKVVLKQNLGPRISRAREAAQARGTDEHERFLKMALQEKGEVTCRSGLSRQCDVRPSIWSRLFESLRQLFRRSKS